MTGCATWCALQKMDIDERQTVRRRPAAVHLAAVIPGVLDVLNLTAAQRALVPGVVRPRPTVIEVRL